MVSQEKKLLKVAFGLAIFTMVYNLAEGILATHWGMEDESLALFGFGTDSFIEVISGMGIAHMVVRIGRNPGSKRDEFERTALRITGFAFYILVVGLAISSFYNIWTGHQPVTTFWGMVISVVSILVMWALVIGKRRVGKQLQSEPILADANCTLVCIYMSVILLISSGLYEWFGVPYVDSVGTLGLAYFAFKEGRECFEKANSDWYCGCD
ncbi:cation transporter [Echinicola vietnamensis]|uniref:Putative Co/Zn/Cd cation transporter n=1 Tax=Echinicola vietnamensis (strain DSM 17526 / LMG 23754 / KMM 6221) TaxID=926556 RepID=L0G3J8_ECHVK|nr:cation transporter [Echinicola vietnamensis]AGA80087.1 putative Co/Zn/Cd cation transporter [Echinicola vietnamensis DSM 17526]